MDVAKPLQAPAPDNRLHFLDYWRVIRIRKAIIVLVFLLVVITTVAVTYLLPVSYSGTARIRVAKDTPDIAPMLGIQAPQTFDPYYLQTEFEVLKSRRILDQVVKDLDLPRIYMTQFKEPQELRVQDCYDILTSDLDAKQFRNTEIIEITAYNQDPRLAAAIANKIAEVYENYRGKLRSSRSSGGLTALTNKLALWENRVAVAQGNLDKLRIDLQVPDSIAEGGNAGPVGIGLQEQSRILGTVKDLQAKIAQNTRMLEKLQALTVDELPSSLAVINPTPELTKLLGALDEIKQQWTTMLDFGPENTEKKKVAAKIKEIEEQLQRQVKGIMTALDAQLEAQKASATQLQNDLNDAIDKDTKLSTKFRPYLNAKRETENLKKIRDAVDMRIAQEDIDASITQQASVQLIDDAIPGLRPVKPRKVLNIAAGVVAGLILGVGLAFFIEYLDTSVKTIDDVEQALQAPVLGVIPQNVGSLLSEGPDGPHAEAYRVLRTSILFSRKDPDMRTLTVVSGGAGEGKSTTIFNLACIFAQQGNRVLLVDSDLRRPSLHKLLGVSNSLGLTNYLLRQNKLEETVQTTKQPGLDFMASGKLPGSSVGVLNSAAMKEFIAEVKSRYDFVLFDSPPIMGVSDASILASEVDMAILVVQYRKYPQQMTLRAKQMVEKVGGRLLGVVLNNINISQDSYYYYYSGYYYDYYSKSEDSKTPEEKAVATNGSEVRKTAADVRKKY